MIIHNPPPHFTEPLNPAPPLSSPAWFIKQRTIKDYFIMKKEKFSSKELAGNFCEFLTKIERTGKNNINTKTDLVEHGVQEDYTGIYLYTRELSLKIRSLW